MNRGVIPFLGPMALGFLLAGCDSSSESSTSAQTTGQASTSTAASTTAASTAVTAAAATTTAVATTTATTTATAAAATTATTASTAATGATATASSAVKKSIDAWVSCSGTTDDDEGVAKALAAAKNSAFTLVVDCPVRIKIGTDITKTLFIENNTTVEFTATGKFIVDNVMHPAFVMANAKNITLTNWNVEYDASLPVNPNLGGFEKAGVFVSVPLGSTQPANAFSDLTLTSWLASNRGITFNQSQGTVSSRWADPTNTCAVFFFSGDTSNVTMTGLNLYVPAAAGGDRFIPVAFSMNPNYKSSQTVTAKTLLTTKFIATPHDLTFSNITLDGTYMGWVGTAQDVLFENIQSHRYGDLQDAKGQNVGGVGKWFAPPHLFYLSYNTTGDPALFNNNLQIKNVVDDGPRVGVARDKGGADSISGYALSIKIGCVDCIVDSYTSTRPDGFLDVLPSNNLTISNSSATFDTSFTHNLYPGWRFPTVSYKNVTFDNIAVTDKAAESVQLPIGNAQQLPEDSMVFTNVKVTINRWQNSGVPFPSIAGDNNKVSMDYLIGGGASGAAASQVGTGTLILQAIPAKLKAGGNAVLIWNSRDASSCTASGAWSGAIGTSGTRTVKLTNAGNYNFAMECRNSTSTSNATLQVVAGS